MTLVGQEISCRSESVACRCKCKKIIKVPRILLKFIACLGLPHLMGYMKESVICSHFHAMDHNRVLVINLLLWYYLYFFMIHTKTKEELDVQLGQVNLYSDCWMKVILWLNL